MLRLIELAIRTARYKQAQGLPAILLALAVILWPFAILWLCPPDTWPTLTGLIPKLIALASR